VSGSRLGAWLRSDSAKLLVETVVAGGVAVLAYLAMAALVGDSLFAGLVGIVAGLAAAQLLRDALSR